MRLIAILVLVGCVHLAMLATNHAYFSALEHAAQAIGGTLTWLLVRFIALAVVMFLILLAVILTRNWLEVR
jgi:hypothetical protein